MIYSIEYMIYLYSTSAAADLQHARQQVRQHPCFNAASERAPTIQPVRAGRHPTRQRMFDNTHV